jgi:uncharacterized membrane protein
MNARSIFRLLLAAIMITAGILHFTAADGFVKIVPHVLPAPLLLVQISGACEIALGLGLLVPRTRRLSGIGLILLYIAVFPANVNMAVNHLPLSGSYTPPIVLWLRLPFQVVLIIWAWQVSKGAPPASPIPPAAAG